MLKQCVLFTSHFFLMLGAEGTSDQNDGVDLHSELSRDFTVQGQRKDDTIFLKLRIADSTGYPFILLHFIHCT